ncbi:MAG: ankyrin repeat protein [Cryomorphaceae bacterium]|jgi:ankyrin repeat protein
MKRRTIFIAITLVCAAIFGCVVMYGKGVTPLMKAAKAGNDAEIQRLIEDKVDLDQQSKYGWTALMFSAWKGNEITAKKLLAAGADPNIISSSVPSKFETVAGHPPSSALEEAIRNHHLDIAKLLIESNAKIDNNSIALAGGEGDIKFLEYLTATVKDSGKTINFNQPSNNAFHPSALASAASAGHFRTIKWLINHGADPDLIAVEQTALKEAVNNDEQECVSLLLQLGAAPNLSYGSTTENALFTAVTKYTEKYNYAKNLAIIKSLLKYGADTKQKAFNGEHTALEFIQIQRKNAMKNNAPAKTNITPSTAHKNAIIKLLQDYTK